MTDRYTFLLLVFDYFNSPSFPKPTIFYPSIFSPTKYFIYLIVVSRGFSPFDNYTPPVNVNCTSDTYLIFSSLQFYCL